MGPSTPLFRYGELCGGYPILELIARGGMGEVYRVVSPSTGEVMALKCVPLQQIADTYVKDHAIAEAELLSGIRHENLVRVDDMGIDKEVLWMAMEYLSGKNLREVMHAAPGPLPIPTALYYAREIADGVAAAHEMRVVHRDLKPENVMITDEEKVKVLDMGAAKFFGGNVKTTLVGTIVGTPLYMAPEHIRGEPVDGRTDIYALGIILYELLAGHHPFARSRKELPSKLEVCAMHIHASPPPLTELREGFPTYVWEIVKKAIAKPRHDRYSSMSEFAQAIRGAWKRFSVESKAREAQPSATGIREWSGAGPVSGAPAVEPVAGERSDSAALDVNHGSMSIANVAEAAPQTRGKRRTSALLIVLVACLLLTGTGVGFVRTHSAGPVALARGGGLAGQDFLSQVLLSAAQADTGARNATVELAQPPPQSADEQPLKLDVDAPPPKKAAPVSPRPNRTPFKPVRKAAPQRSMSPPAVNTSSSRELVE